MKRIIGISIIVLFLIAICISEEVIVNSTLKRIENMGNELQILATNLETINTENVIKKTEKLRSFWKEQELILCFFINYKDMSEMSNEIVRMDSYAKSNIKEEYLASLNLVLYYCESFNHITGLNLQNIF